MLECVLNISEGRSMDTVGLIARQAGAALLDVHTDPDHNRSVLTVVGEPAARSVATAAVLTLDLATHQGVHPRFGVVDVVPFVPLGTASLVDAVAARDDFAAWLGETLEVPCFVYGPERSLPDVRRTAFDTLAPTTGPATPHPSAGACAVGARPVMLAYNLWLARPDRVAARSIARALRGPNVRALALEVGDEVQVSMNLLAPLVVGPAEVFDAVDRQVPVARAELVGLAPAAVLDQIDPDRWEQLDLAVDRTIEARLAAAGLSPD